MVCGQLWMLLGINEPSRHKSFIESVRVAEALKEADPSVMVQPLPKRKWRKPLCSAVFLWCSWSESVRYGFKASLQDWTLVLAFSSPLWRFATCCIGCNGNDQTWRSLLLGAERPWDISTNGLGQDDPASYLTTSGPRGRHD